jgi:hypothetical protein
MYVLNFEDKKLNVSSDHQKMYEEIKRIFPGNEEGYKKYLIREKKKFEKMYPCLAVDYSNFTSMFSKNTLKSIPYLDLGLFLGHRGYFSRNELYVEASITRTTEQIETYRYQGLIGVVVPVKLTTDLLVRPSIFLQPYIDRESNPDFPITYRTLSGLNWRLSASVLYKQMFAITPYINLNARYYTVTTSPVRVESDVHQWTAGLTLHYYWDKNNIQDKLLKFY